MDIERQLKLLERRIVRYYRHKRIKKWLVRCLIVGISLGALYWALVLPHV